MDLIWVVLIKFHGVHICLRETRQGSRETAQNPYLSEQRINKAERRTSKAVNTIVSLAVFNWRKGGVDDRKLDSVVHTDLHLEDMDYDGI